MPCCCNFLVPCLIDSSIFRRSNKNILKTSGIYPSITRGFMGEYLVGDVTGVAVTRYEGPGE